MLIHEAVSAALAQGCAIRRSSGIWNHVLVIPTNTMECCLVVMRGKDQSERKCPRWNPTADDLLAEDWLLTDS